MTTIIYNGKEYEVTDRIEFLISKFKLAKEMVRILESENYIQGKIPEYMLVLYIMDVVAYENKSLENILISKILGKGLISYNVVSKISVDEHLTNIWLTLDYKYNKGIVTDEMIKLICKLIEDDDEYISKNGLLLKNITILLSCKEYAEGRVTEGTIKLMAKKDELSDLKNKITWKIFDCEGFVKDELIRPIFNLKNELVCRIIYQIVASNLITNDEKEKYILSMLNVENHENLLNVYNTYREKKKVKNMEEFAMNFVLYTLPLLDCGLKGDYTRKRSSKQ